MSTIPPQPTLASTLYKHEKLVLSVRSKAKSMLGSKSRRAWTTGVKCLDRDLFGGAGASANAGGSGGVFGQGMIVGVAGVGDLHDRSLSIIHNLIATHLQTQTQTQQNTPNTSIPPTTQPLIFILEPPTTPTPTLLQIYNTLLSTSTHKPTPTSPPFDPEPLLASISILPYLDIIGISQSLSEITETLLQQQQQGSPNEDGKKDVIVLLRGLPDTLASRTASGGGSSSQDLALLSQVLRQLRRLVRGPGLGSGTGAGIGVCAIVEMGVREEREVQGVGGVVVSSAFSSGDGRVLVLGLGEQETMGGGYGSGKARGQVGMEMARLLGEVVDKVVVVHGGFGIVGEESENGSGNGDGSGRCIVEIVEDRDGSGFGAWSVWDADG